MPTLPSQKTWTLRFKHAQTTILLHAEERTSLTDLKSDLLTALRETLPDQTLNGTSLPDDPSDILLAKALDPSDLNSGWESIEASDAADILDDEPAPTKSRGKGKAKARGNGSRETPASVGLKDGSAVAFRFRGAADDGGEDDGVVANGNARPGQWLVVVPKYEDVYGFEGMQTDAELEEQAMQEAAAVAAARRAT